MDHLASKKAVGRPRSLTLDAIVEAACEVGIAQLEMSLVAQKLNTGVATLYGYVNGREHLLELVSQKLAARALVKDEGQSWQDVLREHAAMVFGMFRQFPQLIANLMGDEIDARSVDYSLQIVAMVMRRGLDRDMVTNAYVEINQAVIGAAICAMRSEAVPQLSRGAQGRPYPLPAVLGDYRPTLEKIIADCERRMAVGASESECAI